MASWATSAEHRALVTIRNNLAELEALDLSRLQAATNGMASARLGAARVRLRDVVEKINGAIAVLPRTGE